MEICVKKTFETNTRKQVWINIYRSVKSSCKLNKYSKYKGNPHCQQENHRDKECRWELRAHLLIWCGYSSWPPLLQHAANWIIISHEFLKKEWFEFRMSASPYPYASGMSLWSAAEVRNTSPIPNTVVPGGWATPLKNKRPKSLGMMKFPTEGETKNGSRPPNQVPIFHHNPHSWVPRLFFCGVLLLPWCWSRRYSHSGRSVMNHPQPWNDAMLRCFLLLRSRSTWLQKLVAVPETNGWLDMGRTSECKQRKY